MVLTVDRGVGKIRKALKDNGIDQNTIIIFTKDKFLIIPQLITLICIIFAVFFNDSSQNLISFLGIFSFGILHGANDLKIIAKSRVKTKSKNSFNYLALYITIVFLGIVIFYFIPGESFITDSIFPIQK